MNLLLRLLLLNLSVTISACAEIWTVTHTGDAGPGSLRWAIEQANARAGADTVVFQSPPTDPHYHAQKRYWTIAPLSALPQIADGALTIDGATQRSVSAQPPDQPLILISGEKISGNSAGLTIISADNSVRELCFAGFSGPTLWIKGAAAQRNVLENCRLGVLPDGMTGVFDAQHSGVAVDQSRGILLSQSCRNNRIRANLIANMFFEGILVETSHDNVIENNLIGVLKDGVTPLGNGWINVPRYEIDNQKIKRCASVRLSAGSKCTLLSGNVICAGGRAGVHIESDGTDSTRVIGNLIGVGADGEIHPNSGNAEAGVKVQRGAHFTRIGGEAAGEGNVISGNGSSGLQVRENVSGTIIAGNLIGLNAQATRTAPNAHNGIYLFGQKDTGFPQHTVIGPGNVIIANGVEDDGEPYASTWAAVRLDSAGTAFNTIFGNCLGTDSGGLLSSAYNSGVIIGSGAHDNVVGPDNVISRNRKYGVWIRQTGTVRNTVTRNHIFKNGRKPIVLESGGNLMINPPGSLTVSPSKITGRALTHAIIELFAADDLRFLGSTTASAAGNFVWSGHADGAVATQTDVDGNSSEYGETSGVPVELTNFTAEPVDRSVLLRWRTESESSNLGFYIERGWDFFREIGFVSGAGTTTEAKRYSFVDAEPPSGAVAYRLRQVDCDGTFVLSPTVTVHIDAPTDLRLLPPFPNPFNQQTTVVCELPQESQVNLTVVNSLGQTTAQIYGGLLPAGAHRFSWDGRTPAGESAASGIYFLRMAVAEKIFQQKLLLLQ